MHGSVDNTAINIRAFLDELGLVSRSDLQSIVIEYKTDAEVGVGQILQRSALGIGIRVVRAAPRLDWLKNQPDSEGTSSLYKE